MDSQPKISAKLRHPFTAMFSGATSSGKTVLIRRLLKNHRYTIAGLPQTLNVLWCFGTDQELYKQPIGANVRVKYHEGLIRDMKSIKGVHVIVVDDLMTELASDETLVNLFTKHSHHSNISVIFVVQNLFTEGKYSRTISRNAKYIFLMKNARDKRQIATLASQIYPGNHRVLLDAYEKATKPPYGYLCIDFDPRTAEDYRLKSRLTPEETPDELKKYITAPIIYKPIWHPKH